MVNEKKMTQPRCTLGNNSQWLRKRALFIAVDVVMSWIANVESRLPLILCL